MNQLIDTIDAYLDGKLPLEEGLAFEERMKNDSALREMVESQRNLRGGMERLGVKSVANTAFRKITLRNKFYKWGMATVAAAAVAGSVYLWMENSAKHETEITYELPATNELGGNEWADADRNLPTQLFRINPEKDTVIETSGGIVFAIPAGAFIDAKDPMTIEVREALTPFDIMKAGLSTTSNGELLETGGMFYLNARNGETSLKLNPEKPVYANVPTDEIRPGMQLFDGERKADGSINWVNPKPMEKQLIPVDIFSLNFYPQGFLEKVAQLGFDANNREVTDSIYYSYAGRVSEKQGEFDYLGMTGPQDSLKVRFLLVNYAGAGGASSSTTRSKNEAERLSKEAFNASSSLNCDFDAIVKKYSDHSLPDEGQEVWITSKSRSHQDIAETILSDGVWMNYHFSTNKGWYVVQNLSGRTESQEELEIDPARIAAIRSEKFQNTLIATKEFEERLQVIFQLRMPELLDAYVNNLDKKMYEIDSVVMNKIEGNQFREFYARHDGGVSISKLHMKELQEYYEKKHEAVRMASEQTFNARTTEQRRQDSLYLTASNEQDVKKYEEAGKNFQAEYEINLRDVYQQLGISPTVPTPIAGQNYYGFDLQSVGWKNVDAYVREATLTRTSMNYTDPQSGKTAQLTYEPLEINVAEAGNYTQLMVYLVSDSLPCFMRIFGANGVYSEKLNGLLEYSLVVIGEKDGLWFSTTTPKVTPGSVNVKLSATDESSLRDLLNRQYRSQSGVDFDSEITFMKQTHAYNVRKEKEKVQTEIDRQIMEVIFPGYVFGYDDVAPPMSYK